MHDGARLAEHCSGFTQHFNNFGLRLVDEQTSDLFVRCNTTRRFKSVWWSGNDATVATDDGASWQIEFTPPNDVGEITERTNHGDTSALIDLRKWVSEYGNFDSVQWRANSCAKEGLVTIVIRMSNECNTCC